MLFELMLNYPTSCSHNCKLEKHTWNLYYMNLYNTILHMNELSTLHYTLKDFYLNCFFFCLTYSLCKTLFNFNLFFQNYLCQEQTKGKLVSLIPWMCALSMVRLFHIKFQQHKVNIIYMLHIKLFVV